MSGGISLPSWFPIWASYITQCLFMTFEGGHSQVAVSEDAFERFNDRLSAEAAGMAFSTDTKSVDRNE